MNPPADPPPNSPSYASELSRCRWLGPTPEILIWWIQGPCQPLQHFGQAFPMPLKARDAWQCLRPLQEIGEAIDRDRIDQNLIYLLPSDGWKKGVARKRAMGFFIDEMTQSFGGFPNVCNHCRACPLNGPATQSLAGCCGALIAGDIELFDAQSNELSKESLPLPLPDWSANTSLETNWQIALTKWWLGHAKDSTPTQAWYQFANRNRWSAEEVDQLPSTELLTDPVNSATLPADFLQLLHALRVAKEKRFPVHFALLPRGFSDGHDWWLGPHCFTCHAPMTEQQTGCEVCGSDSGAVPIQKRRVMGWAPYWPLETLIGESKTSELLQRWTSQDE